MSQSQVSSDDARRCTHNPFPELAKNEGFVNYPDMRPPRSKNAAFDPAQKSLFSLCAWHCVFV